jgi:hypothetical protein
MLLWMIWNSTTDRGLYIAQFSTDIGMINKILLDIRAVRVFLAKEQDRKKASSTQVGELHQYGRGLVGNHFTFWVTYSSYVRQDGSGREVTWYPAVTCN